MRGPLLRPIVIAAGGTGGHFFPAEALAATLIERGHRIVLMTDARSGFLNSAVFAGSETHVLPGAGLAGRGFARGSLALLGMLRGTWAARALLGRLQASVVVGFGGYPSVPPILAARSLAKRPRVVLHEQNAVLGRANRALSRLADRVALGFASTTRVPARVLTQVTGNPVRPAIQKLSFTEYVAPHERIALLVVGGSLGARIFSDVVPAAIAALPGNLRARLSVTQQCRKEDVARVAAAYKTSAVAAELSPFFTDMPDRLQAAHLVIGRAGASTCAELAVAGRPSILVPLPGAIDNHQAANAAALSHEGAAIVIDQADFQPARLTDMLAAMLTDPAGLARAAAAASRCCKPDAAARLADLIETLLAGESVAR